MRHKPEYLCDLHCNTSRSDGNDTYQQLIENASNIGMRVIAITDHDIIPENKIDINGILVSTVDYDRTCNLEVLLSIEFSCDSDIDDVHIIGLGCKLGRRKVRNRGRKFETKQNRRIQKAC